VLHDLTTFGGLLADLRERRGPSQFALSVACGWPANTVSRLEAGTRKPTHAMLDELGIALGLDADDTGRLYVAAGVLPPGAWVWCDGWVIRPASDMPGKEETTNGV
jgi:transcriptional regulator with XRE-family HTH domain